MTRNNTRKQRQYQSELYKQNPKVKKILSHTSEDSLYNALRRIFETNNPHEWKKLAKHLLYTDDWIRENDSVGKRVTALLQDYIVQKKHTWNDMAIECARIFRMDAAFRIIAFLPNPREHTQLKDQILHYRICHTMDNFVDFDHPKQSKFWERFAKEKHNMTDEEIRICKKNGEKMSWILSKFYKTTIQDLRNSNSLAFMYGVSHNWTLLLENIKSVFAEKGDLINTIQKRIDDILNSEICITPKERLQYTKSFSVSNNSKSIASTNIGESQCKNLFMSESSSDLMTTIEIYLSKPNSAGLDQLIEVLDLPCARGSSLQIVFQCCEQMTLRRLISGLYMIHRSDLIQMILNRLGVFDIKAQIGVDYERLSKRNVRKHLNMHSPLTRGGTYMRKEKPNPGYTQEERLWMATYPFLRYAIIRHLVSAEYYKKLKSDFAKSRWDFKTFCKILSQNDLVDQYTGDIKKNVWNFVQTFCNEEEYLRLCSWVIGKDQRITIDCFIAKLCQHLLNSWTYKEVHANVKIFCNKWHEYCNIPALPEPELDFSQGAFITLFNFIRNHITEGNTSMKNMRSIYTLWNLIPEIIKLLPIKVHSEKILNHCNYVSEWIKLKIGTEYVLIRPLTCVQHVRFELLGGSIYSKDPFQFFPKQLMNEFVSN